MTLSEELTDQTNVAYCLEGLAVIAGARGEAQRCGRRFGSAEGLLEAVGVLVYVYYEPHRSIYERTVSATRSGLGGGEGLEAAQAEGREMTFEQALAYALDRVDREYEAPPT